MKIAVVYYSFEGNTRKVANQISKKLNADIYELKEVKSTVPKTGFFKFFWGGKQVVMKEKPDLQELNINIDKYDYIFIGTPVWSFTYCPAIRSFLNKYNIKGKKIGIFCCHSGGLKNTIQDIKDNLTGNEFIAEIDLIEPLKNEIESNEKIEKWLDNINL
jgi:flavodoxin